MTTYASWRSRFERFERLAQGTYLSDIQQTGSLQIPSKSAIVEQDAAAESAGDQHSSQEQAACATNPVCPDYCKNQRISVSAVE